MQPVVNPRRLWGGQSVANIEDVGAEMEKIVTHTVVKFEMLVVVVVQVAVESAEKEAA